MVKTRLREKRRVCQTERGNSRGFNSRNKAQLSSTFSRIRYKCLSVLGARVGPNLRCRKRAHDVPFSKRIRTQKRRMIWNKRLCSPRNKPRNTSKELELKQITPV